MFLSIIILYVHYYFFKHKLFLEKDEELEKFIIKRNPQIKRGKCEQCDLLRVMRSFHCIFCGKCTKKYQLHSDWFNICIGSNNELLYSLTLCFTILYYFISNIIFWYYLLVRNDLLNNLAFIFTIFAILGIYIIFNSFKFLYSFIFENLFVNLTIY
jgi:carbon starvation protein CstA